MSIIYLQLTENFQRLREICWERRVKVKRTKREETKGTTTKKCGVMVVFILLIHS